MPELSPARAIRPAEQPTVARPPNTPIRSGVLPSFRSVLKAPPEGPKAAHGPRREPAKIVDTDSSGDSAPRWHSACARRETGDAVDALPAELERPLDPMWCQLAGQHGGAHGFAPPEPALSPASSPFVREDLQALVSGLARRIAWGGDKRKGSARLELAEGALAGATLVVHTDEQRAVSVELELPAGASASGWQARIQERLEARGFTARVRIV